MCYLWLWLLLGGGKEGEGGGRERECARWLKDSLPFPSPQASMRNKDT